MRLPDQFNRQRLILNVAIFLTSAVPYAAAVDLVGYLPYYRMNTTYNNSTLPGQLMLLNEIRYFGLTAASNGTLTPLAGSGSLQTHKNNIAAIKQKIEAMPAAQRPRLDITLGGAGEAASFVTIAGNTALSATFAQNIKSFLDETGATSVDIDWEHPVGTTQFNQYGTMLQRIKQEVGTTSRVYATIDPTIRVPLTVFSGTNAIDGISLMTYELAWWANDPADTNRGEHSLPQYVTDSVDDWTDPTGSPNRRPYVFSVWGLNAAEQDLGIGLPFFGRVIGTSQSPQGGTAYTYSELTAGGTPDASGNYYTYLGKNVWTAGGNLVEQRVQYAHDRGLQHIIIWELGQDLAPNNPNSLLLRAYNKKLSLMPVPGDYDGDRDVDATDYTAWRNTFGQTGAGLTADGNGNQVVDAADYVIWRKHFASSGGSGAAYLLVPEPPCQCLLLLVCQMAIVGHVGHRHRP